MRHRQRKQFGAAKRAAAMSVATATAGALVVSTSPSPSANSSDIAVKLTATTSGSPGLPPMELAPGAPDPASIPDLSFGLGPNAYQAFQAYGAQLESAFLDNVNLAGVLERLGYDPETAINNALAGMLENALKGVGLPVGDVPVIGGVLSNAGVTNVAALLTLLGVDLSDPLGLNGPTPGLNIITTGPPFSLLKFLGIDLGWVPGFPNSVADEINETEYLGIGPVAVLQTLKGMPGVTEADKLVLDPLILTAEGIFGDSSAIDVRVPVVVGFGLGAFAAGMAYPQVVEDLPNQSGGTDYEGTSPLAGSVTILPMILLRNPGRANGGLFARFYPLAALVGIDTVTPDTEVTNSTSGGGVDVPIGNTGIRIGGANLIPIKVDGTVEYDPLSDFPAWPNPVSLLNSAAALAFPTYILRGVTADNLTEVVTDQLTPQLAAALADTSGPLALNLYLTVPVNNALPLLEPVRLPVDAINLLTGANLNNPVATAFEPALTTLVNLGYTDVERTVVDGVPVYDRTLDQGHVITPFGTLPSGIDWAKVPEDLVVQLIAGTQKAIDDGLVSDTQVANPLTALAPAAPSVAPAVAPQDVSPLAVESEPVQVLKDAEGAEDGEDAETPKVPKNPKPVRNPVPKRAGTAIKNTTDNLNKAAQQSQQQLKKVFNDVADGVQKTVKSVTGADRQPAGSDDDGEQG